MKMVKSETNSDGENHSLSNDLQQYRKPFTVIQNQMLNKRRRLIFQPNSDVAPQYNLILFIFRQKLRT